MKSVIVMPDSEQAASRQVRYNNINDAPNLFCIMSVDNDDEVDGRAARP